MQIHNWGTNFEDDSPNLEFVAPTSVYVVVNGEKTYVDLAALPVSVCLALPFLLDRPSAF